MNRPCTFCDRTQFEERLVFEGDNFNVIATLGQITDGGYVLLAPKMHIPCIGAVEENAVDELTMLAESLCAVISCEYSSPVTVFEYGIVGQTIKHAHLHFLPAHVRIGDAIGADFPLSERDVVGSFANLTKSYKINPEPYLFWIEPNKGPWVCWNPAAPLMYLRIVAAKQLGKPERANWRTTDQELDSKLWQETVLRLKPYFI